MEPQKCGESLECEILKARGDFLLTYHCFSSQVEAFHSYSWKLDFFQLAEVVNGQNFFKVFLLRICLKLMAQVMADNKKEWTSTK